MKAKTLLELMTLSSNLYMLSKDEDLMNRLKDMAEKGKDRVNKAMSEEMTDDEGNELEFVDKLIRKAGQAKEELEGKIEDSVAKFYKSIHVAHLDEVNALSEKLEQAQKTIALMEARLNKLEAK